MSAETELKPESETPETSDAAISKAIDGCMQTIDKLGLEYKLDGAKMVYLSVMVSAQLLARNLFLASGPFTRDLMRKEMEGTVSEILESAAQHMDRTEREMASMSEGGIILPQ